MTQEQMMPYVQMPNWLLENIEDPVLKLVMRRFAQSLYEEPKITLLKQIQMNPRIGKQREATKEDCLAAGAINLPEEANYEHLATLPEGKVRWILRY